MNKRIKKKRIRLSSRHVGFGVYTPEEIKGIIMTSLLKHYLIPRIYFTSLDPNKNSAYVWRKINIKRALKYMYKHRNQYLSIRHLTQKDEFISLKMSTIIPDITDGESIKYNSSALIYTCHIGGSYENHGNTDSVEH